MNDEERIKNYYKLCAFNPKAPKLILDILTYNELEIVFGIRKAALYLKPNITINQTVIGGANKKEKTSFIIL